MWRCMRLSTTSMWSNVVRNSVYNFLLANRSLLAYIVPIPQRGTHMDQATGLTSDQELSILMEIGQILSSTLELRDTFGKTMQIVSDQLNMHRGALVLLDESTGRLRTVAAVGLTADEMDRGKYAVGE